MSTAYAFYRVTLTRADDTDAVEYRKRRRATTAKGMSRQHDGVVNDVIEELRYYRIEGWKKLTVARVPADEVTPYAR